MSTIEKNKTENDVVENLTPKDKYQYAPQENLGEFSEINSLLDSNTTDEPVVYSKEDYEEKKHLGKYSFPKTSSVKITKEERTDIKIDSEVKQNRIDSDRDYRGITKGIIKITKDLLDEYSKSKKPLRKYLMFFVMGLLGVQLVVLALILFLNSKFSLQISDFVINVYIVSLFVETLAGLMVMIRFSFDSTQEVYLIKILHSIIRNFKKFDERL